MKLKIVIGTIISVFFLYLSFQQVDLTSFWDTVINTRYYLLIFSAALFMMVHLIRAYRWKYLMILQKNIRLYSTFSALYIGYFANNVLPMRAGEFLRAYVIGRNENIPKSTVLATILVERIIDVLSLLITASAGLIFLPIPHNEHYEAVKGVGIALFVLEAIVILFCVMLIWKKDTTLRLTMLLFSLFPENIKDRGSRIVKSFLDGLEVIKISRHYFTLLWTTAVIWLFNLFSVYIILIATGVRLDTLTMFVAAIVTMIFSTFAVTVPSSPGYVGTYHYAAQVGLQLFSVSPDTALGFAFILHMTGFLPVTVIGFFFFLRENLKLAAVKNE